MSTLVASTGNVTRQFGTFSAEIQMGSGSTVNRDMSVANLPVITQDFDIQEESEDINEFKVNLSDVTIKIFDGLSEGESLFSYIEDLTNSDTIRIKIITTIGNFTGTDVFISSKSACKYDWRSRTVEMTGTAALRRDVVVTGYDISSKTSEDGWVAPKDLITQFLLTQGISPTVKIVGHFFDYDVTNLNGTPQDTPKYLVLPSTSINTYNSAQLKFLRLSVIEGAVIGTMMGYAFYVRRNYVEDVSDNYAEISADDLENFGIEFNARNVRNVDYDFSFTDQTDTARYTNSDTINSSGAQDLDVTYGAGGYKTVEWDGLDSFDEIDVTLDGYMTQARIDEVGGDSKESYENALGIVSSYQVTFDIFGVGSLKPYQYIKFQNDIHPALNGKKVRASYLEYDLENDLIKGEGYIIG